MRKILIYTENYQPGGGNRYLIDIVNSIAPKNEVYVLSNRNGLFPIDFRRIERDYTYVEVPVLTFHRIYSQLKKRNKFLLLFISLTYHFLSFFSVYFFKIKNTAILKKKIKKIKPDLVFSCNGGYPGGYTCLDLVSLAKKNQIPVILTIVSVPKANRGKVFEFHYGNVIALCDKIIVNSAAISQNLIDQNSILKDKFTTLHNCVNLNDLIDVNKDFSETLKSKYNCNGSRIIGYVGRIEDLKGINVLLRAFSEVIAYSENVKLVIVGSGHIEKAKELAIELEIADHVNFTGFYDGNIYDVLNSFDIFVFPSLWEGLPYAILEAMLLKKIIISTNVGGIPEVIENEVNGILVDPSNYSQLSSAIIRVLSNFNEYEKLGIQAYEKVTSRLSLKDFAEKINYLIDAQTR